MTDDDEDERTYPPHPLFPRPDGEDETAEIAYIYIRRQEPGGWALVPRAYAAGDLTSEAAIWELYGGGTYEVIARSADRARITRRATFTLGGAPRPLAPQPEASSAPVASAPPVASIDPSASVIGAVMAPVMALMGTMMQSQSQLLAVMLESRRGGESSDALTEMIRAQAATNAELLRASLAPRAASDRDTWREGFELGRTISDGAAPAEDDSTAERIVNGLATIAGHVAPIFVPPASPAAQTPAVLQPTVVDP